MKFVEWLSALVIVGALAVPASAGKLAGVTMPDSKTVAKKKLVLNGMGLREATVFNVDVYVAGLYLETRSSDAKAIISSEQVKQIHLRFVRDVDRDDMTDAWKEGFKKNGGKALKSQLSTLNSWMSGLDDGESMLFTYVPGTGTTVVVKGKTMGTIKGADFARVVFAIWLGPKPPNGGLKKGMLGSR